MPSCVLHCGFQHYLHLPLQLSRRHVYINIDITMATEVLSPCFFYITELKHCARNYITCAFICFLSILSIYLDLYGFKIKRNTFHWFKMVDARWRMVPGPSLMIIDLFTDSAAILNLLDLRSIMGCTGGTRSEFTLAFRPKRQLHCIFLGKKVIIITSKHGTTIFFSHYNLFLGKR